MPLNNDTPHIETFPNPKYGHKADDVSRKSDAERTDRREKVLQPGLTQVDYGVQP